MDVFLVEDDPICRDMTEEFLADLGHRVASYADSQNAWSALESIGKPQYLITDWSLPGMDGLELCRKIRRSERLKESYVMMLTGKDSTNHIVQALQAGADDLVAKPFDLEELSLRCNLGFQLLSSRQILAEARTRAEALTQTLEQWAQTIDQAALPNTQPPLARPQDQATADLDLLNRILNTPLAQGGALIGKHQPEPPPIPVVESPPDHWDEQALVRIAQVGGQPLVDRLIDLFAENAPKRLEVARWAHSQTDSDQLEAAVHSLRSSAGNLGALGVRDLAACIEILAEREDLDPVEPLLIELENAVGGAITRLVNAKGTPPTAEGDRA